MGKISSGLRHIELIMAIVITGILLVVGFAILFINKSTQTNTSYKTRANEFTNDNQNGIIIQRSNIARSAIVIEDEVGSFRVAMSGWNGDETCWVPVQPPGETNIFLQDFDRMEKSKIIVIEEDLNGIISAFPATYSQESSGFIAQDRRIIENTGIRIQTPVNSTSTAIIARDNNQQIYQSTSVQFDQFTNGYVEQSENSLSSLVETGQLSEPILFQFTPDGKAIIEPVGWNRDSACWVPTNIIQRPLI